jgi:hypothetical protein
MPLNCNEGKVDPILWFYGSDNFHFVHVGENFVRDRKTSINRIKIKINSLEFGLIKFCSSGRLKKFLCLMSGLFGHYSF